MYTVSTIGKAVFAAALGATATALAAVNFVECPKCDKRIRISEDGREAFVNMSRIDQARKSDMKARAERLLEMARPVKAADPATPLMGSVPTEPTITLSSILTKLVTPFCIMIGMAITIACL